MKYKDGLSKLFSDLTKRLIGFKLLAVLALKSENETVKKECS